MKGDPRVEFALGAIGEYYPELIDLLKDAITSGRAVSATALAVDPARIYSGQELAGERRCVDALIRKHWDRCVADGLFSGTCEIAFHPDTGVPQIYTSQSTPEDNYTAAEQALELLGALITDHWCAGETPLTMETWMTLLAGDEAIDTFDPRLFKRSTIVSTGLLEQGHYLVLCLALLTGVSPEELLRRFALMDRGPLEDLLGPCPDDSAVAAARFRVAATFTLNEVQHRNETTAPECGVTECAYGGSEPIDQARIRTLNSEQLRPPSEQHNNADLIVWALHLCGGAERWVDVEELYLKAFELAPARLSWRTREDLPDYKKCAKALQEGHPRQVPDPTGDRFERGDPLRRQHPSFEAVPMVGGPYSEFELGALERLDMADRDAGMAFAFDELREWAIQPPPEVRRSAFEDGQLEFVEVVDAEDPEACRFKELLVADWPEGGEAAESVEFGFEAEVVGLQRP